jgi:DNA-binding SARP family transcriptional activator
VLEFRILGPLEVANERGAVAIGAQKQRALLAVLLLHANEVVSVDRLVESLWGEEPPRTAQTSLQNFVAQLRKLLGPDVVETRPPGYRIAIDPDQLDLARFERLVAEARREPEPAGRAAKLVEALALWRGEPLADFAFDPFAEVEVLRLEELRLVAQEERIGAELELGRHAELVPELEALVAENPLRERLRGQLMRALYASGRQAEALAAFQSGRRRLVDELGIEPGPELQEVHRSILRREARIAPRREPAEAVDHLDAVAQALLAGRLVPVLGTSATASDERGAAPPDVAERLAEMFGYAEPVLELARVSQYVAMLSGPGRLYDELHELYAASGRPEPVHRVLASLPPLVRGRGLSHQLVVTTAYDVALEAAFGAADEQLDVVAYLADGPYRGRFCHLRPDGTANVIELPNTYATELSLDRASVLLKLHGGVDPSAERRWESFVVTEDDYIDYLAQSQVAAAVPVSLVAKLRRSHFLFLGYALRDWNLRLVLNRLWGEEKLGYRSWAVQPQATALEQACWRRRDVELVDARVDEYVDALRRRVEALA